MDARTTTTRHLVTHGGDGHVAVAEQTLPAPGPGEVLIRIAAAPVNPVDPFTRDGAFHQAGRAEGTVGLGWDLAGTIETAGRDADDYPAGTKVIGLRDDLTAPVGAHGEAVVLPLRAIGHAPRSLEPIAASTLPLNALTAFQALDLLDLPEGASLLVTGAAGAVGGFAVELAAACGLRVVAQAGEADHGWLRARGAAEVVGRFGPPAGSVDAALDAANLGAPALVAVRDGGRFVGLLDPTTPPAERDIAVQTVHVRAEAGQLDTIAQLADDGRLTPRVADTYTFDDAGAAYARVERGGLRGRVVLVP
jgi:NADPH:quinone reductase-like Zn-dependent oxidoreductase